MLTFIMFVDEMIESNHSRKSCSAALLCVSVCFYVLEKYIFGYTNDLFLWPFNQFCKIVSFLSFRVWLNEKV